MQMGAPIIGLNDSGGARIQEGVRSLAGYAEFSFAIPWLRVIPPDQRCYHGSVLPVVPFILLRSRFYSDEQELGYMFIYRGPDVVKRVLTRKSKQGRSGWSGHPHDKVRRGASIGRK